MPDIHPTAILDGDVQLADGVRIGPHCVVVGPVTIGSGTRLAGNVWVQGPMQIGRDNLAYPFTCLGFAPQHVRYEPERPGAGTVIGDGNVFREHVTIHRAFEDAPTRIGDRNWFMAGSHAAHDAQVASDCVFVNNVAIGGHATIGDHVTMGGGSLVHQFVRIGRGAMISGGMGTGLDVPPFFMLTGHNICGSINIVGLRRRGAGSAEIDTVRWIHRTLCRRGLPAPKALQALHERADDPLVAETIAFLEQSSRGFCTSRGKAARSVGGEK